MNIPRLIPRLIPRNIPRPVKVSWLALAALLPLALFPLILAAQSETVIPLASEPHHHLVLHNDFVNLFDAKARPGDTLVLHRHERDAVAIAIGDQEVTVSVPGKPDVHQKNADEQVRMQAAGYVHATHVEGAADYYTIAIELLQPQTAARNLCATVLVNQPLHCGDAAAMKHNAKEAAHTAEPQFESDQTRAEIVRVAPRKSITLDKSETARLIVVLDPASMASRSEPAEQSLRPGDFVWLDAASPQRVLHNKSEDDMRYIILSFQAATGAVASALPAK